MDCGDSPSRCIAVVAVVVPGTVEDEVAEAEATAAAAAVAAVAAAAAAAAAEMGSGRTRVEPNLDGMRPVR